MSFKINFFPKHFFIYIDGENTLKWWWHENPVKVATSKIEIFCDTYICFLTRHPFCWYQTINYKHAFLHILQPSGKTWFGIPQMTMSCPKKNVSGLYIDRTLFQVINIKFNFIIIARPRIFCRYREQLIRFSSRELIFKRC